MIVPKGKGILFAATAGLVLAVTALPPARADAIGEFYKDRTITVIVPAGSGGSFHLIAQIVARHLGKHIPGHPSVVTQNRPGAGGVTASNYMANAAPRDGTVIAEMNPGSVVVPLMRKLAFDPREFEWLGVFTVRTYTLGVWHTVSACTVDEWRKTEVIMGSSGIGSLNHQIPAFINYALGTKFKVISGYKGGGAINLAMERGEVQGRGNFYSGYTGAKPDWLPKKLVKLCYILGPSRPEVEGIPELRPLIPEGEKRQMYDLLVTAFNVGQAFHTPPGVAKERVEALRTAFAAMLKDPAMRADTEKHQLPLNSRDDKYVTKVVNDAYATPPAVAKKLADILNIGKGDAKKK